MKADFATCSDCGAALPAGAPAGPCPACLLKLGEPTEATPTSIDAVKLTEDAGSVIGRYKLLEKLGEGGFGAVWAAEQREPVKRRVALKIIKLGMDTKQVVARFEAERQALALMDHPNIAKVLDAGTTDTGRPFFVMELVKGIPVTKYCDHEKLGTQARLELFIKVCQAIQHAHQKGIIHRDIKPSNILVTLHDGVPVPKVIDFGIAKATQQELTELTIYTQHHQFIGTPAYMSPEQAEMSGLDIDTRSDIYSLGVLLYELLTGKTPFDAKELMQSGIDEMRRIIREQEPVKPSTRLSQSLVGADVRSLKSNEPKTEEVRASSRRLLQELKGDLDWIVMKCLEKDRSRRYDTANGLAADLKRHLANEPVVARPPSAAYRLQKTWRRHRVLMTAGFVVAFSLSFGIGFSLNQARRARAAEQAKQALLESERQARMEAAAASSLATAQAGELRTNLYFNRIALAHRESTAQPANVKRAEQLLDECPPELREWEWHYLKRRRYQMPVELHAFGEHKAHCVTFSANGRFLAAGGGDGTVRIWDVNDHRLLRTLTNHAGYVASVAFSPVNPDWIASAGADNRLRLWDWREAREIRAWPSGIGKDYGLAQAVAFSPDGRRLAAPGTEESGEAIVYEVDSGATVFTLGAHEEGARCTAFSPDGRWLLTGSGQGEVTLWNAATGGKEQQLGEKGTPIGGLAFTSHPPRVVALQFNGMLRIWDLASRQESITYPIRQTQPSVGLAAHPSGTRLVTGGLDRWVTHSDPFTGQQVLVFRELNSGCYSLAFSPDGNRLAAASRDGGVFLWDARPLDVSEDRSFRTIQLATEELRGIDLAPNGRTIAIGGQLRDGLRTRAPVEFWSLPGFERQHELPGHGIVVFNMSYDLTGRLLASAGDEPAQPGRAKLKVWDMETRQEAFVIEPFQTDERFFSSVFSHDGRWLVGAGNARKLRVWSASTGRKIGTLGDHDNEITKLALSPDGQHLASIGNDDVVKVWDGRRLDQAQANPRQFPGLCGGFTDLLAFSPDSHRLAIVASDDRVRIHRLDASAEPLDLLAPGHRPLALAFSPDGRWIASGGVDCTIRVWDAATGGLRDTLRSHVEQVTRLRFLSRPEGAWLVSGSRDGTVKFWEIDPTKFDAIRQFP